MVKVAAKFSVSGSYMARVCSALNVPRPYRGYWAKLEVRKAPDRSVLPESSLGEPQFWSHGDGNVWQPAHPTVAYIGAVPFGLAVIEMTEETTMRYLNGKYVRESEYKASKSSRSLMGHTWTTTKTTACGRLRLIVYAPQQDVSWSLTFQETVRRSLAQDVKKIVKSIENSVEAVRDELAEAEKRAEVQRREWDEQRERWRHEEDQRRSAASRKESREQLMQAIQSWATTVSIEQFFKGVEERADKLPAAQQALILERLQLARETIGTQDPLEFFKSWKAPMERYMPLSEKPHP